MHKEAWFRRKYLESYTLMAPPNAAPLAPETTPADQAAPAPELPDADLPVPLNPDTELIALNSAIAPDSEEDLDEATFAQALLSLNTLELLQYGVSASKSFRLNRLHKAMVLHEAKQRYSKGGVVGRRKEDEMTWQRYCDEIGQSRTSADSLIKSLTVYRAMNPALRAAAAKAEIDLLKPKVVKQLQMLQEEMWSGFEPSPELIVEWVERLREAEARDATIEPELNGTISTEVVVDPVAGEGAPDPDTGTATSESSAGVATRHQVPSASTRVKPKVGGPGPEHVFLTGEPLKRILGSLQLLRLEPEWNTGKESVAEELAAVLTKLIARLVGGA